MNNIPFSVLDRFWHIADSVRDMQSNGKELSAVEVVRWLKQQAKVFEHMASQIETAFKLGNPTSDTPQLPKLGIVTPAEIREAVSKRAARVADLAKQFGVHEGQIRQIIDAPDSGLVVGDRGWIKPKGEAAIAKMAF